MVSVRREVREWFLLGERCAHLSLIYSTRSASTDGKINSDTQQDLLAMLLMHCVLVMLFHALCTGHAAHTLCANTAAHDCAMQLSTR